MLRWFHALMPKEERFVDLFAQHSRAVVAGGHVSVAGTAPVMPNGEAPPPDAYGQAKILGAERPSRLSLSVRASRTAS